MDSYRTSFEKTKSSGMDRMLGYIDNSNSIIRDVSTQKTKSLDRTPTTYEQTCVMSNAKGKKSYLDTQECVKIPYMILSDPTNLLFGLDGSMRNSMDVYRISTTNYDQKTSKSRFLKDMNSSLKTLNDDITYDTKTNLVSLAKQYSSFIDLDNITKRNEVDHLTSSILTTHIIQDENIDPANYSMNMFESSTINPGPSMDELLLDLTIKDNDTEVKLVPTLKSESKVESKSIFIKGSTIKPKVIDKELGGRNHKPIVYGLSSHETSLSPNPINIASGTQTDDLSIMNQNKDLKSEDASPVSSDEIIKHLTKVQIGYRDTFDTTPKMMETYSKINYIN